MNGYLSPIARRVSVTATVGIAVAALLSSGALQAQTGKSAPKKSKAAACCAKMESGAAKGKSCPMGGMGKMDKMNHAGHAKAAPGAAAKPAEHVHPASPQ